MAKKKEKIEWIDEVEFADVCFLPGLVECLQCRYLYDAMNLHCNNCGGPNPLVVLAGKK